MVKADSVGLGGADDEVLDFVFGLQGRAIAIDYADRLWRALRESMSWLADEPGAGVHPLAGVSAGDFELYLTRRARLILRLPGWRAKAAAGLVGKARRSVGREGEWRGFSLMIAGLDAPTSLRLQHRGIGGERGRGCGIFVPHKSVAAVGEA